MMITPLQLKTVFPKCHDPNAWCRIFTMELLPYEINTPLRVAAWIAQCGYESQSFNRLRENGSYTAQRLMQVWPKRFPTLQAAKPYEYNPEGLLDMIYAGVDGNGPPESRDGLIYRGGGLIQLTGRANYRVVGQALGLRLEAMPKMIEQPNIAARTSAYFWKQHDLNAAADAGDLEYITKKINPDMAGYDGTAENPGRLQYYAKALLVLSAPPPKGASGIPLGQGIKPGPGTSNIVSPPPKPGPEPGPVKPGTQDGVNTPGGFLSIGADKRAQDLAASQAQLNAILERNR